MEKKTILAACAAATLAFTGCSGGFSAAEEETIHAGKGEIMRILTVGNPADSLVLRQKAAPVTGRMLRTDDYAVLRRRMLATVQDPQNTGVGIAAPQVGILRRMIAVQRFDKPGEPFEFYLNPEIVESSAETAPGREGCLSIPGLAGRVVRAQRIVLRYRDERFAEKTETIHGRNLPARNRPSRRNSLHRPDGRSPHAGRVASPHRSDQFAEVFQIARGRRHGRDGHVVAQDAADFQPAVGGTSGRNVRAASEARPARRPPHPRQAPVRPGRGGRCARDSVLQCGRQHRRGSLRDHDRSLRKKVPPATHRALRTEWRPERMDRVIRSPSERRR